MKCRRPGYAIGVPSARQRDPAGPLVSAVGGVAGLAGAALYDAFLAAGWVGSRLNPLNSFVSELEVPGQPASGLFRAADLASGLLIIAFAVALYHRLPHNQATTIGCTLTAVLGAASVADARYPMPCAPSTDPSCQRHLDDVSLLAQLHQRHTLSSTVGVFAAIAAMWLLAHTSGINRPAPRLARACRRGAAVLAGLACLEVPLTYLGRGAGAAERLHVLLISTWIAALAIRLIHATLTGRYRWYRSYRWPRRCRPPRGACRRRSAGSATGPARAGRRGGRSTGARRRRPVAADPPSPSHRSRWATPGRPVGLALTHPA